MLTPIYTKTFIVDKNDEEKKKKETDDLRGQHTSKLFEVV
jgi:hypothetical protein